MTTSTTRFPHVVILLVLAFTLATAAVLSLAAVARGASPSFAQARAIPLSGNQTYSLVYRAWNGHPRAAVVVLPKDYLPGNDEALPCIVQPHARHATPAYTATIWRDLPTTKRFIVICPDSAGRVNRTNAWGVEGQIQDIMDMPDVIEASIPWVRIDRERLYMVGVSMGGQEALDTLARFPDRFAASAVFDAVSDLGRRYYELAKIDRFKDQADMRREVGGTPRRVPFKYKIRSAQPFARTLAYATSPLAIWWSRADTMVINGSKTQSGALCRTIRAINPAAPLAETVTRLAHGVTLRATPQLALDVLAPGGVWRTRSAAPPGTWSYSSWLNEARVWGSSFRADGITKRLWRVDVVPGSVTMSSPVPITMTMPWAGHDIVTITLNGEYVGLVPLGGTLTIPFPAGSSIASWVEG